MKNESTEANLTKENYNTLVSSINNSIIGTSKLLHFIRPDIYPIIDSRVARYLKDILGINFLSTSKEMSIKKYNEYKDFCHLVIQTDDFKSIYKEVKEKLSFNFEFTEASDKDKLTKIRILEYLFFTFGKKDSNEEEQ